MVKNIVKQPHNQRKCQENYGDEHHVYKDILSIKHGLHVRRDKIIDLFIQTISVLEKYLSGQVYGKEKTA
jgi:hypothetical protein